MKNDQQHPTSRPRRGRDVDVRQSPRPSSSSAYMQRHERFFLASERSGGRLAHGSRRLVHAPKPIFGARDQVSVQLVGEVADALLNRLIAAQKKRCNQATAGTATTNPMAVMIKASPTGPATLSIDPCPETPIAMSAFVNTDHGAEQSDERPRSHRPMPIPAGPVCMRLMMASAVRCSDSVIHSLVPMGRSTGGSC